MKKPITNEKFYITNIPLDEQKISKLIDFLGDSNNWIDNDFAKMCNCNLGGEQVIFWNLGEYTFGGKKFNNPKPNHTVITYDYLLANYLPKNSKLNKIVDESIKEIINEDYQNKSLNNGGKTDYYQLSNAPFKINDFDDFAEWRGLNGNQFNIGKAVWTFNVGRHSGTDYVRDLNKIKHYVDRELLRLSREIQENLKASEINV